MKRSLLSTFAKDTGAAAAVEMALVLPMLFALMFTTFEGGSYMWTEHKVLKGVRDGARYAARLPFDYYDCGNTSLVDPSDPAAESAFDRETEVQNLTRTGRLSGGATKVEGWLNNDVQISVSCNTDTTEGFSNGGIYSAVSGGAPHVVVATRVSYPSLLGRLGFNTSGAIVRAQADAAVTGI